jgi:hypothetical protein
VIVINLSECDPWSNILTSEVKRLNDFPDWLKTLVGHYLLTPSWSYHASPRLWNPAPTCARPVMSLSLGWHECLGQTGILSHWTSAGPCCAVSSTVSLLSSHCWARLGSSRRGGCHSPQSCKGPGMDMQRTDMGLGLLMQSGHFSLPLERVFCKMTSLGI